MVVHASSKAFQTTAPDRSGLTRAAAISPIAFTPPACTIRSFQETLVKLQANASRSSPVKRPRPSGRLSLRTQAFQLVQVGKHRVGHVFGGPVELDHAVAQSD